MQSQHKLVVLSYDGIMLVHGLHLTAFVLSKRRAFAPPLPAKSPSFLPPPQVTYSSAPPSPLCSNWAPPSELTHLRQDLGSNTHEPSQLTMLGKPAGVQQA